MDQKTDQDIDQGSDEKNIKFSEAITNILLLLICLSGTFSILIVPKIETYLTPVIIDYGDNFFGWLLFLVVRVFTVVIFPLKLGVIAVIYHRAIGFPVALIISTLVFVIGGSINFYFGKKYKNKLFKFLEKLPLGKKIVIGIQKFQKIVFKSKHKTYLIFLAFSYEILSYIVGMKDLSYRKFFPCLMIGGFSSSLIMLSRDFYIGKNDLISLCLQLIPFALLLIVAPIVLFKKEPTIS